MALETRRSSGGLGRGLAALIPQSSPGVSHTRDVPVTSIQPHPDQPRRNFDPEGLQYLADSIAEFGLLQPIIVTESNGASRSWPENVGYGLPSWRAWRRSP
jgi:ParB family chromosome partitioning protein